MEDLFYFSRSSVQLMDIIKLCDVVGLDKYTIGEDVANTYYHGNDFWQWFMLDEREGDFDDFSVSMQSEVSQFKPKTALTVAHCVASLPKLKRVLAVVMAEYGGWVSYDLEANFSRMIRLIWCA